MKFHAKKDAWLAAVVWTSVIAIVIAGVASSADERVGTVGAVIINALSFLCAGFTVWLWQGTYVLDESSLCIRCGPFRITIPYQDIVSVKPVRSILASMATSSDRLEIRYGRIGQVHISPADRERFQRELQRKRSAG